MAPQRRAVSHEPQPAMADTTTSRCSTMSNCSSVSKHASMSSYHTPLSGTPSGSTAGPTSPSPHTSSAWYEDRWNLFLLVTLYTIQGLPMGFVFGSIPFMLKERISYEALAVFSFAGWPYSIKLFVAPIVDSVYSTKIGRRKSWILPAQTVSGFLFLLLGGAISRWIESGSVTILTAVFFSMMSVTAMQDIAVDSWALTLLQQKNLAFASTCQSVGLGIGYFMTFTIFLAFQDPSFSSSYVRPWLGGEGPVLSLSSMMRCIGLVYLAVTVCVLLFKTEAGTISPRSGDAKGSPDDREALLPFGDLPAASKSKTSEMSSAIAKTYVELYRVTKLPAIRQLIALLLIAKVGFSAHENVSALKLLDAGFPKQTMATMAVFQAPVSLLTSILAGRLSAEYGPVRPFVAGFCIRSVMSLSGPLLVSYLRGKDGVVTPSFYLILLATTIIYSIGSDLCFVAISALFLSIGDKDIGGSYLTLLATCSNMGGMWPKSVALFLVDRLSVHKSCILPPDALPTAKCPVSLDGYYVLSLFLAPLTIPLGLFVTRQLSRLHSLPKSAWRVHSR